MYSHGGLFMCSRDGYFGVYFLSRATSREINTKITLDWAHKQFITKVHALFYYYLHDITYPKIMLKTRIFTHHPCVSLTRLTLMMSQSIGDDVAMTRLLWPEHVTSDIYLARYQFSVFTVYESFHTHQLWATSGRVQDSLCPERADHFMICMVEEHLLWAMSFTVILLLLQ